MALVDGKYSARNQITPKGWGLNKTWIRADLSVGLMELLSQLKFPQLVMAVGDGQALRDKRRDDLQGWHQQQLAAAVWPRDDGMAEVWEWLRSRRKRGKPRQPLNLSLPTSTPASGFQQRRPPMRRSLPRVGIRKVTLILAHYALQGS